MSILGDLINSIKTPDLVDQMRILCDQIFEQESQGMNYIDQRPQGANIFLCLQVPGSTKDEVGFLALERDNEDLWLVSFWSINETDLIKFQNKESESRPRKKKIHEIKDHRPEKVLTQYAKLFKFYNGE
jgi:hypothetical protein